MEDKVTYDNMMGMRIFRHHKWFIASIGLRASVGDGSWSIPFVLSRSFGAFDIPGVAKNMIIFSAGLSVLHKHHTFLSQEKGIFRLGRWLKKVQTRRAIENIAMSNEEAQLRMMLRMFYYGAQVTPWIMAFGPIIRGDPIYTRFPYIDHEKYAIFYMVYSVVFYNVVALGVSYTGSTLVNILITFRHELQYVVHSFEQMRIRSDDGEFANGIKENVSRHVELCRVFKDLKKLNNTMFGYQVLASTFTTCSLIFSLTKDVSFIYEAFSQVIPVAILGLLEYMPLCWLGEHISLAFEQVHRSVYLTNWYEAPLKDQSSIKVIQEFSKEKVILTGYTVIPASLNTFLETLKKSFSLYTILKAMK